MQVSNFLLRGSFVVLLFIVLSVSDVSADTNIQQLNNTIHSLKKERSAVLMDIAINDDPNTKISVIRQAFFPPNETAMNLATESYDAAREFMLLSIKSLTMAKELLEAGDIDAAEKYIEKSNSFERAANIARESIEPLLDSAKDIAANEVFAKSCFRVAKLLTSLSSGPAMAMGYGVWASSLALSTEYEIDKNLAGQDIATQNLIKNIAMETIFTVLDGTVSGMLSGNLANDVRSTIEKAVMQKFEEMAWPVIEKIGMATTMSVVHNIIENLSPSGNTASLNTGNNSTANSTTGNSPTAPSFKFGSNVDASGYGVQTTGLLTGAGTAATGSSPQYVAVDPTGRFAYVSNGSSNTVSVYTINQTTGALTAGAAVATGVYPQGVAVDPTGRFAYAANNSSNSISVYTINQTTGALTAGAAVATGDNPHHVAVDPTGRFAYAANYGSHSISVYTINQTTGALTAGAAVATGVAPSSVAVDPTGRFAYVSSITSQTVSVYTINQTTGALTAGTAVATEVWPLSVSIDPTGRFAYAANYGSHSISVYTINQTTGALTPVGTIATNNPYYIAFDPTGKSAYVTNGNPSPATVSTYTINQTTGMLTLLGTTATTGNFPQSIVVDPTGKYAYVTHEGINTVSNYTIDPSMQLFSSVLTGSISGTASPGGTTPITMTGSYDPASPSSFLWGQTIYSYNGSTGQNTTYDNPPNAYAGYLTGYKADDNTMKAKWASIYVKDNGSAGIHLGTLTGTAAAPNYTMSGTINAPVEMVSGGIGFTPANLYPANVVTTSLANGTPILASGVFSSGGTMSPSYNKWESLGITGQEWGVWSSVSGGSYTGPTSSDWSLSEDYNYSVSKTIVGGEVKGTSWTGNKLEGTKAGYGADVNTGKTWISIGDVIGTYDPVALTYQAVGAGSWIETNKFLWMAANEPSKLQALNIPCVQVGNVNLAGSNNYGTGTMNVTMNNMKFFANTAGGPAKIWAVGQSQMGSWTGTTPPAGTAANISGGGLNATFTVKAFDVTTTNKFNATITNGTGGFNGSTTFRGAATGTINTAAKTFSGTAAGVAK